jgi:hypothetical protein
MLMGAGACRQAKVQQNPRRVRIAERRQDAGGFLCF